MLFNSLEFAIFLILVLAIHHLAIPKRWWRGRKIFLVVASYVFYMSWNPFFGLLLAGSTLIDFVLGLGLERTTAPTRRRVGAVVRSSPRPSTKSIRVDPASRSPKNGFHDM